MKFFFFRKLAALLVCVMMMTGCAQATSLTAAVGQMVQPEQTAVPVTDDASGMLSDDEWAAALAQEESILNEAKTGNSQAQLADDWWNVLLMGCDSYTTNEYQRSDSMIIVSINRETSQVKMTSLMRDTWVSVSGKKGSLKLTEACVYGGPEMTMRAINENFGMNISEYALVSLEGMAEIVDLLGGIELDVTEAERKAINKGLFDLSSRSGMEKLEVSGENVHLNGNQATAYARIRNIDSDYVRTERQRTVLMTIAKKIRNHANAATILMMADTLLDYVDTNLSFADIMSIGSVGLSMDISGIEQLRLPADGTFVSGEFNGTWCIKPNFEKNTAILHEFIYG